MKIRSAEFIKSSPTLALAPELGGMPEFAMVGRSNVGKSSLINCLLGRKALAKTSNTPGKTRLMNFYLVNASWVLVDLPGYGYAKVSKTEQAQWRQNFEAYLAGRGRILAVFQLVDARHGPQSSDLEMYHWLAAQNLDRVVVLNKADKLSKSRLQQQVSRSARELQLARELVFPFSATSGAGRKSVLGEVERRLGAASLDARPPFRR